MPPREGDPAGQRVFGPEPAAQFTSDGQHHRGLIGEAALERVGLPLPKSEGGQDSGMRFYTGMYEKVRARARSFIANRIDLRSITGETAG